MVSDYRLVAALFVRLLGLFYVIACVSLSGQVLGLAGSEGILPFADKLAAIRAEHGLVAVLRLPTLFWFNASDAALLAFCWIGAGAGLAILLGVRQRLALVVAWACYLSLYHATQPFLNFQWDTLLLEAGFLAIFLTPNARVLIWLFRWLLFRLRFLSGVSKLVSADPAWSGLTALTVYFEVQPLPNPLSWWAHHLPDGLLRAGTALTLIVELLVPLMMFLPRRWRFAAAWITIAWQVLIILTSNHNWFNFLTIALCLFLFDDRALRRVLPAVWARRLAPDPSSPPPTPTPTPAPTSATSLPPASTAPAASPNATGRRFRAAGVGLLAGFIVFASSLQAVEMVLPWRAPGAMGWALNLAESWAISNKYHVFPTMKAQRFELEILGSRDGRDWLRYPFRHKPGAPGASPGVVIPHQPRLDWMMWFVTLNPVFLPWFDAFLIGLLENRPAVTGLLADNPFAGTPPTEIRVNIWRYRFTTPGERGISGDWWHREALGPFPPLPVRRLTALPAPRAGALPD